jgi:PTS system mannose-specific IIB component/fructoselysine and glucoselysine-specific PTS system IIB component
VSIVLYRVDERLIHGQVVIGWGHQLRPHRYIVVDDELAVSQWEQDLYRLGSGDVDVLFATVQKAREDLGEWRADRERSILLTRDTATMRRLSEGGLMAGETLNLGGLRHGPGRAEVLTYLHLNDEDVRDLEAIAAGGVDVTARDLPDAHKVSLETIAKSRWKSSN